MAKTFIQWQMPGIILIGKYKDELKGVSIGKDVIRFTNPDKIDLNVVKRMLTGTYEFEDSICGYKNGT